RSIASLTVSFGLVSIPVKLYSATEAARTISFNLLHKGCGSRLRQQYMCIKEDVPVGRDEMVKGFEFAKDQYVMFSPEELKALDEASTQSAEITEFVPIEAVDPVYFDKAYYLAPDKGGAKPYALLAKALRESNRCALGRYAARGKQYIVMIRPVEDGLVMQQLLYAGEVRPISEIEIPKTEVKAAELKLAQMLIEQQASETFDPSQYTDEVSARIEQAVQKKVEGHEITMSEPPVTGGGAQVIDLMDALRASLEKKKGAAPGKAREPQPAAAPAAARKPPKRAGAAPAAEPAARKGARK
ncbi:MAG TPA: Ku protein, partial [Candidatus Binatia bacterium]|nr:Ku protein [Candidatus Binatia bacterium]